MSISTVTKLKEWEAMLHGPLPVAVLFKESTSAEVPNASVLDNALHGVALHHPEKARYLTVDIAKVEDVAEAASINSAPQLQVFKQGRLVGGSLTPETMHSVADAEEVLLRHILKSRPS